VKFDLKLIKQLLDLSVFIMMQYFISISTWFLFFIFIERMGERPLAATNIGRSLYILLMIPGSALATTVNTIVSNLIGAGKKDEVMKFINRILGFSLLLVIPVLLITFFFPELFASIYTNDAGLIAASVPVLKVVALAQIFCALGNIIFNAVSGTGNTRTALVIEFFTLFFYLTFVYYTAIINPQAVHVVWMSEFVYWTLIGVAGYIYLLKGNWHHKKI
jgi:Na+-driven multidrug efflux pump